MSHVRASRGAREARRVHEEPPSQRVYHREQVLEEPRVDGARPRIVKLEPVRVVGETNELPVVRSGKV